jgi:hypothetical protein
VAEKRTINRRTVLAGAAGAVAGVAAATSIPAADAATGGGPDGAFINGSNFGNIPNTASTPTVLTTTANFGSDLLMEFSALENSGSGVQNVAAVAVAGRRSGAGVFASSGETNQFNIPGGGPGQLNSGLYGYGVNGATGVTGNSTTGVGAVLTGGLVPLRLTPSGATGAPTADAHTAGELYVDSSGELFYCTAGGTPGTWVQLSAPAPPAPPAPPATPRPVFITLQTPDRFVDTRSGLGGVTGPLPGDATHVFQMTGRTGVSGDATLQIPDAATAIVGNLTVVGAAGIPLGSFVTLWPGGPRPTVSNVNVGPGTVVANSYVVGLGSTGGYGSVSVYNQSAGDYILDVTGYYIEQ